MARVTRNRVEEGDDGACTSSARKIAVKTKQGAVLHMCTYYSPTAQDILTRKNDVPTVRMKCKQQSMVAPTPRGEFESTFVFISSSGMRF